MKLGPIIASPFPPTRFGWLGEGRAATTALVALAIAVRLGLILAWPQTPFSDGAWYLLRAGEMARGMSFQEAGHATAFWPVGYPALLAASIRIAGDAGPMLVNLLAAGVTIVLILWFARVLGAGASAGRIAALLYALYPAAIVYAGAPLSEVSSTAVAMAAFATLLRARHRWLWAIAAGLLFGAATLMRAQMLFFPIGALIAMMLAWRGFGVRPALRVALLCHLAMAAVILPWTWRNERMLGSPVLVSTNGGVALFTGAYDGATGDWTGWESTPVWNASGIPFGQRVERQVELDRRFKALAKDWIADHPLRWTLLGFKKAALVWRKDSDAFWSMHESYPAHDRGWTIVAIADQLYYVALLALSLPALAIGLRGIGRRDASARLALLGCMPAFVTLTAFAFTGQVRYHFPAMPFVAIAAGWTVSRLWAHWLSRRSGSGRPAA